ncbi:TPA: hypothetical protein ACH3X1_006045 [Trebouxia sp. C0004]
MSIPAAYAHRAGSQLLQVQQHVADMQAQDIPVALTKCLYGLLSMLQTLNTTPNTAGTAADAQQDPDRGPADTSQQQQQMESTALYVQCCLCMTKRACQLATAGQGVLQDVAGLLQDQLQRSGSLVTAIFCQHCNLLLQDALSLDMLLRIVPLLRTEQQAAVYKAFLESIVAPLDTDADARQPQAVASLTQHCHRQLEQFVLSKPILPSHPGEPLSLDLDLDPHPRLDVQGGFHEARVRVMPQLPALLALCLALPHWTSSVRSLQGVAASACPCSQSAFCAVTSSTTASSPGSMLSNTDATASVSDSQLSTAALSHKLTRENGNTAATGQGPLKDAVLRASNPMQEAHEQTDTTACDTIVAKAGLLLQHLMHPAALLTVLGLQHHQHQSMPTGTQAMQAPSQLPQSAQILSTSNKACYKGAFSAAAPTGHAASGIAAGQPAFDVAEEVCPAQAAQQPQHLLPEPVDVAQASSSVLQQQQLQKEDSRPSLLVLLGLVGDVSRLQGGQAFTGGPENQEEDLRQRVARLGGIVMNLVEVFLNTLMTQPETLGPILGKCLTSEGCTPAGKDSTFSSFESGLSPQTMAVVLHLLALHSALQAAHKAAKTKTVTDPVFMSLSGAHGLLKFAVQLLTEKAGSKPQRRRSRHVTSRASDSTPALDAHLAAYLLTLVGHVIERGSLNENEQLGLANQAVTAYTLVRQEDVFSSRFTHQCASAQALRSALLRLHSSSSPPPLKTATSDAAGSPRALPAKRPAFKFPGQTAQSAKRKRSGPSRLGTGPKPDSGIEPDSVQLTHSAESQLLAVHEQPVTTAPPLSRRIVPLRIGSAAQTAATSLGTVGAGQAASHRIRSEQTQISHYRRGSSSSSRLSQQEEEDDTQQPGLAGRSLHRQTLDSASPGVGSDSGVDEGLEGGSPEGSEGVEPSKLLVEFGSAGDAWWHDFIAAKEEMLAEVLRDDPDQYVDDASPAEAPVHLPADPLASTPSVPSKATAPPALRSSSSASGRRRILTADEVAHKRQHQKALLEAVKLLTACLKHLQASDTPPPLQTQSEQQQPATAELAKHDVMVKEEGSRCQIASDHMHAVLIILQALCDQQQLKAHVMTACQLIDPSMGYAAITAANAGASTYALGSACLVLLGHLVACFAQDFAPSPILFEAYLSLLGMVTASGHHEHCTLTPGRACTPPHKVLSDALQALVAKIPLPALKLSTVNCLLKMVLDPLPHSDSAAMGAATMWAVVQGCGVGPGGVTWPDWAQCVSEAWAHAWMYKISTRQRRTAVVHLISHCNARLQAMLPDLPPAQHPLHSSSSPLVAAKATSNSPEASASDAQTQHQKLPTLSPSQQLVRGMVTEQSPVQSWHASAAEEEGEEKGSRADGQCAVQAPLVEAEAGQAVAAATLELILAVLRGSEDTDANSLGGEDVLCGLVQLATHVLTICSAAQSSLVQWLSTALSAHPQPTAAMPASEDDSGCELIDLTADDDNDSAHDAARLASVQHQNSAPPLKAADTGQAVEAAELAAANCTAGQPPEVAEAGTSSRLLAAANCTAGQPPEVAEAGTSSRLPDQGAMAELCMLDAYGMDLVAATSCMLQHFEDWPDSNIANVQDLRGATTSFKEQNATLLAQLMPQDDMSGMPTQQAALHDALGSAIQQHCCIVGQDVSDRQDSASEAGSDACTDDSWSESESEIPGTVDSVKASGCELTRKAAGLARQKVAKKSANPFIQAAMAEARQSGTNSCQDLEGDGGSYSDLEDFIVCKPDRNYTSLFSKHYKYSPLG